MIEDDHGHFVETNPGMPEDRKHTSFCSDECWRAYNEVPASEPTPNKKRTLTEVMEELKRRGHVYHKEDRL
jgi:hypothetical protein